MQIRHYKKFLVSVLFFSLSVSLGYSKTMIEVKKFDVKLFRPSAANFVTSGPGISRSPNANSKWAQLIVKYKTNAKWLNMVEFKFYAQLGRGKKAIIVSDNCKYINVQKGNIHYAVMYIHPNTLARYGDVERAVVEVWSEDALQKRDYYPSKPSKKWWEKLEPLKGLLLNSHFVPFSIQTPDIAENLKANV